MKDLMKMFSKERTTEYFKDYAINQIRVAFRIMAYLSPDEYIKPVTYLNTMKLFLDNNIEDAIDDIIEGLNTDMNCSQGLTALRDEAVELAKELRIDYIANSKNEKLKRREELLKELEAIDKELIY